MRGKELIASRDQTKGKYVLVNGQKFCSEDRVFIMLFLVFTLLSLLDLVNSIEECGQPLLYTLKTTGRELVHAFKLLYKG